MIDREGRGLVAATALIVALQEHEVDYRRLQRSVDGEDRWAVDHLHAMAVDVDTSYADDDPETVKAQRTLAAIIMDCGWAP